MKFKPGDKVLILDKTYGVRLIDSRHIKKFGTYIIIEICDIEKVKKTISVKFKNTGTYYFHEDNLMKVEDLIEEEEFSI